MHIGYVEDCTEETKVERNWLTGMAVALYVAAFPLHAGQAAGKLETEMGVEAVDEKGCVLRFVSGDQTIQALQLAVNVYGQNGVDDDMIVSEINRVIDSGCPVNEADEQGLTPLNAAILFNEPALVELLLSKGADPDKKILRPGKITDGMNSYEFADMLAEKDDGKDRQRIRKLLEKHGAKQ